MAVVLQFFDVAELVVGQGLGHPLGDAELPCHALSHTIQVAGEHDHPLHAHAPQSADNLGSLGTWWILQGKSGQQLSAHG